MTQCYIRIFYLFSNLSNCVKFPSSKGKPYLPTYPLLTRRIIGLNRMLLVQKENVYAALVPT